MVYQCWGDPTGSEPDVAFVAESTREELGVLVEQWMQPLYSVRADDWAHAVATHFDIQGYDPYVPFHELAAT